MKSQFKDNIAKLTTNKLFNKASIKMLSLWDYLPLPWCFMYKIGQKSDTLETLSYIFSEIILICSIDDPRLTLTHYMALCQGSQLNNSGPMVIWYFLDKNWFLSIDSVSTFLEWYL